MSSLFRRLVVPRSWLLCVFGLLLAWRAEAQPLGSLVVIPVGVPDLAAAERASAVLEAELAHAHPSVISLHDARDRFTARSRPPQLADETDVDVLARAAREAIEHVAFGRTVAAQKSVREVIARAERMLESLNRETATARQILDTCLSLVRTSLQSGKRDAALDQAMRCRRLVPDLAPSELAHPANVVGVLAEADNLLRRMHIGRLTVRSTPESQCSVYLNGRHLGTTPFLLDRAPAGDYRVQVECGESRGRVHGVQLGDRPSELLVDTRLDAAVASEPRLMLRYDTRRTARAQAVDHAVQVGRDVGADDVLLLVLDGARAELLRVQVSLARLVGRVTVPWSEPHGFPRPALERAVAALVAGRFVGEPSLAQPSPAPSVAEPEPPATPSSLPEIATPAAPPPAVEPPAPAASVLTPPASVPIPPPRVPEPSRQRRSRRAGFGLLGGAVAMFTLGAGFEWRAQRLDDDLSARALELGKLSASDGEALRGRQHAYDRAKRLRWLGVGGGALALASTPLLVAPRGAPTWWGYGLGALGVGLSAAGGVEIALRDRCRLYDVNHACRRERDSTMRGVLWLSAAAPLLSVPLLQLVRLRRTPYVTLIPEVSRDGLVIALQTRH